VEACPTDAITHGHGFELATFNATNLVYRKEQLLAPIPGGKIPLVKPEPALKSAH
jgi:NADH-quinone oxidoreductase subunit I